MVHFGRALSILLVLEAAGLQGSTTTTTTIHAFQLGSQLEPRRVFGSSTRTTASTTTTSTQHRVAGSLLSSDFHGTGGATAGTSASASIEEAVLSLTSAYLESLSSYVTDAAAKDIDEENAVALRRQNLQARALEFQQRADAGAITDTQRYELNLQKPIGLQIQETVDGYVQVTGFTEKAPKLVRHAVKVGDRVVAVDASLGDKMWPVSTVEGVVSACTSRLPGQSVRLQFERPASVLETTTAAVLEDDTAELAAETQELVSQQNGAGVALVGEAESSSTVVSTKSRLRPAQQQQLLSRCRDILRRYSAEEVTGQDTGSSTTTATFTGIVADKVMDALASASVAVDSYTLSMVMTAYLSCRQPDGAMRAFESAVGFSADGSTTPPTRIVEGKDGSGARLVPNESALNLYTATALLQAHALTGDLDSVNRVVAALEGRSGVDCGGLESAPWPWTGTFGTIQPDTTFYNIALSAAERIGGRKGMDTALSIFHSMGDVKDQVPGSRPSRNVVTYNTMINALLSCGEYDEAFTVFDSMKQSGTRPDKYTYTSLIRGCASDGDVFELMYDMKERGIEADVVTYNTMIKALCDEYRWEQATKLVAEMESNGIAPDSMTYGYLMTAMLNARRPSACLNLFESACASERASSLTNNVHLYTMAITASSVLGDYERALELVSRMNANGVRPNIKTLTAVMGACLAADEPDVASQVYLRIENPDGYAMTQGIRALCASDDVERAATILKEHSKSNRVMSGKDVMVAYKTVIGAALERQDYDTARGMMTDLLSKNFIPGLPLFSAIMEKIGLYGRNLSSLDRETQDFKFLLFVVDSLRRRNLPIEGRLYTAVLNLGSRVGGLPQQVASHMVQAKEIVQGGTKKILSAGGPTTTAVHRMEKWESLLLHDDDEKEDNVKDIPTSRLPTLSVRVKSADIGKVLHAEQRVVRTQNKRDKSSAPRRRTR